MFNSLPVYNNFCHLLIAFDADSHFPVYSFVEIDHEILSTCHSPPSPDSRRALLSVTNESMYVHEGKLWLD